jgi:hypothetical protein
MKQLMEILSLVILADKELLTNTLVEFSLDAVTHLAAQPSEALIKHRRSLKEWQRLSSALR